MDVGQACAAAVFRLLRVELRNIRG